MSGSRPTTSPRSEPGPHGAATLALVLLAILVYLPALRAGFIWDDGIVTENPLMRHPGGWWKVWFQPSLNSHEAHYWPLVYTSFWFEHQLWGNHPLGYHFNNLILHAACAWLLWRLLRRLDVPGAWLGAALFAVHPVHTESVAWIAERKDVLSGALYLGATLAYLEFHDGDRRRWHALALALFFLALTSKSIVVTLPLALAPVLWWKDGALPWRRLRPLLPFVAIGMLVTGFDLSRFYTLSASGEVALSLLERTQLAGRALWFYPQKLLWPNPLVPLYPKWALDIGSLLAWLPLLLALVVTGALWLARCRVGRAPLVAWLFYVVTLSPALGLVKHGFMDFAWVADRFQYLASIGPLALAGAVLVRPALTGRGAVPAALLLLLLGALTWRQSGFYRDQITLFRHNVAAYPTSWTARCQLSAGLRQAGRLEEAADQMLAVLQLQPEERHKHALDAAMLLARVGRGAEAEACFAEALRLHPTYPEAHYELACWLVTQGASERAADHFLAALRGRPEYPETLNALAHLRLSQRRPQEAARWLRRAVQIAPENPFLHTNLAMAHWQAGETDEAIRRLETALRLDGEFAPAHANLGSIRFDRDEFAAAAAHLERALRDPGFATPALHSRLAESYRRLEYGVAATEWSKVDFKR